MKLEFLKEEKIEHFKNGKGAVVLKMVSDELNKIALITILPHSSIGMHTHDTSSEIIYVKEGKALAICENETEELVSGSVHYCKKGMSHLIVNDSDFEFTFFACITNQ